jgi:hypothetical protein
MPSRNVDYYLERPDGTVYMVRNGTTEEMPRALNLEFDGYLTDLEGRRDVALVAALMVVPRG